MMKHLTTLVTNEAAQCAKDVLKKLHEVDADVVPLNTQGSIGTVYELWVGDHEDMGLLALCVESYVIGRYHGLELGMNQRTGGLEEAQANTQADVDHHEASPWH
jgi:hypothetical protein